jgi:hypothetical protein
VPAKSASSASPHRPITAGTSNDGFRPHDTGWV